MPKWIQIRIVADEEPAAQDLKERTSFGVAEDSPALPHSPWAEAQDVASVSPRKPGWLVSIGGGLVVLAIAAVAVWFFAPRSGNRPATVAVAQLPANQIANQVAPRAGDPRPVEGEAVVIDTNTDAVSAEVVRRLSSDRRVAMVNGESITEAMLEREVGIARVLYPLRGIPLGNDAQTLERMRSDILSSMIDERLLVQAAREAGFTVSEANLNARIDEMLSSVGLSQQDLVEQLSAVGVTLDDLRASLHSTMLAERFVAENPPPSDVSASSAYGAWVKVLQKQGDIQVLASEGTTKTVKIGQPAPDFTLRGPKGETVRLADFAGQPLLINFWATWCPPCRFEMPLLQQTYEKLKDKGFVVLAVDVQEGPELVNPYIEQMGLTFPVALDRGGSVANAYRVAALPTTVFVDSNGIVTNIHRGALVESTLQRYLDEIIEK